MAGVLTMQALRILVIHNHYRHRGGEDVVVDEEVKLLRENGHVVQVWSRDNAAIDGMPRVALARETVWSTRSAQEIDHCIDEFVPDLIHVHNSFPLVSPSLYWTASRRQIPVVQTLHNFRLLCLQAMFLRNNQVCEDCMGTAPWRGVVRGCYHDSPAQSAVLAGMLVVHRGLGTFQRKITRYIALNEFSREKFIQGGLPAERISVKPNFVDFHPVSQERRQGALFVGRLSAEKGLTLLGQALQQLPGRIVDVVGDGPEIAAVLSHPQMRSLGQRSRTQVLEQMQSAAFLVMPSIWYETFGMVQMEALACGLPVIAPRMGSMKEMIEHMHTGLLFEPGSASDLARCMEWAWRHPQEIEAMGRNARIEYLAKYTPEQNYRQLVSIYDSAMEEMRATLP
jgi:glycosyltransferase involved in cell wall biosynthesis